jgi:hypothetical protein
MRGVFAWPKSAVTPNISRRQPGHCGVRMLRGQALPLDLPGWLGAPGVTRLIAIGEPAQPDGWQNFMYSSWGTAGQYAKQH